MHSRRPRWIISFGLSSPSDRPAHPKPFAVSRYALLQASRYALLQASRYALLQASRYALLQVSRYALLQARMLPLTASGSAVAQGRVCQHGMCATCISALTASASHAVASDWGSQAVLMGGRWRARKVYRLCPSGW